MKDKRKCDFCKKNINHGNIVEKFDMTLHYKCLKVIRNHSVVYA